eukprot:UN17305
MENLSQEPTIKNLNREIDSSAYQQIKNSHHDEDIHIHVENAKGFIVGPPLAIVLGNWQYSGRFHELENVQKEVRVMESLFSNWGSKLKHR